jgi:hypothetical protein
MTGSEELASPETQHAPPHPQKPLYHKHAREHASAGQE